MILLDVKVLTKAGHGVATCKSTFRRAVLACGVARMALNLK
jgi:hypothetical protein